MQILYYIKSRLSIKFNKPIEKFKNLYYYNNRKNPKKNKKEAQNMEKAKTYAGVERERERATTLTNNNQAKKLALLSICKTDVKDKDI